MRTVSLAILILTAASLAGCCCTPMTGCVRSEDPDVAGKPQVLLETTCLMYGAVNPLTDVPMATATISEPMQADAAQAILEALEARDDVELLVLPSIVTLAEDYATIEVGETIQDPFIGQHLELRPRLRPDDDWIEVEVDATWRDRDGSRRSKVTLRRIHADALLPSGGSMFLVAAREDGKPGYAVLLRVTRLDPEAGS